MLHRLQEDDRVPGLVELLDQSPLKAQVVPPVAQIMDIRPQPSRLIVEDPAVCQRLGICEQTLVRWRQRYGGLTVPDARRLKDLESENGRLKRENEDLKKNFP